jgi:hypothetical protein
LLSSILRKGADFTLNAALQAGDIKLHKKNGSVTVRLCDGRRMEELPHDSARFSFFFKKNLKLKRLSPIFLLR